MCFVRNQAIFLNGVTCIVRCELLIWSDKFYFLGFMDLVYEQSG